MCVFLFPTVFKFRHLEAFRYRSLQLLSLYSLCSRRPYGGRLVYYLSISSAYVVALCLATREAGHAEFNWNHVGFGGKREKWLCSFYGGVMASLHLRCPLLESVSRQPARGASARLSQRRVQWNNSVHRLLPYPFFWPLFSVNRCQGGGQRDIPPLFFHHGGWNWCFSELENQ